MSRQQNKLSLSVETVEWTPESAKQIGLRLEGSLPQAVLRWGFENCSGSGSNVSTPEYHCRSKLFGTAISCGSVTQIRVATSVR